LGRWRGYSRLGGEEGEVAGGPVVEGDGGAADGEEEDEGAADQEREEQ